MYHKVKNPLKPLGYTDQLDFRIYRKYLKIPKPYLRVIFQLYPRTLQKVPLELHSVIERIDTKHWGALKMSDVSQEEQVRNVKYKIAGVPPMYINRNELPSCAGATLGLLGSIVEEPEGFSKMGQVLYFHSEFEDNALLAASRIMKSAVTAGVPSYMLPFPRYMSGIKEYLRDDTSLGKVKSSSITVLTLIGTEYVHKESGFTEASLMELVRTRKVEGKSTILTSHLTPADFSARYFPLEKLGAVALKFEDPNSTTTIAQLTKELAAIKKAKESK